MSIIETSVIITKYTFQKNALDYQGFTKLRNNIIELKLFIYFFFFFDLPLSSTLSILRLF